MGMGLHFNLKQRFVMLRYKMGFCCLGFKEDDGVVGPPCVWVSNFNKWPFLVIFRLFFLFLVAICYYFQFKEEKKNAVQVVKSI